MYMYTYVYMYIYYIYIYKITHIYIITHKDLLMYITRNSLQYPVMAYLQK